MPAYRPKPGVCCVDGCEAPRARNQSYCRPHINARQRSQRAEAKAKREIEKRIAETPLLTASETAALTASNARAVLMREHGTTDPQAALEAAREHGGISSEGAALEGEELIAAIGRLCPDWLRAAVLARVRETIYLIEEDRQLAARAEA